MRKSFSIAALAALTLIACNSKETKSSTEISSDSTAVPAVNQDSIDKAHGHSHDPSVSQDSSAKAHGHSHDAPEVKQDSTEKVHGHAH